MSLSKRSQQYVSVTLFKTAVMVWEAIQLVQRCWLVVYWFCLKESLSYGIMNRSSLWAALGIVARDSIVLRRGTLRISIHRHLANGTPSGSISSFQINSVRNSGWDFVFLLLFLFWWHVAKLILILILVIFLSFMGHPGVVCLHVFFLFV